MSDAGARRGTLIAFEGLDQSGKQTQAEGLRDRLRAEGVRVLLLSFPDYTTPIGREIERALRGERRYPADVVQLLYIANRYEWKGRIEDALAAGTVIVCDRYLASSVAYGDAQGLDALWLMDVQRNLPQPDVTILLDIPPAASAQRKTQGRDAYERDLALLARVRDSYLRQVGSGWVRIDADRDRAEVAADVSRAVTLRTE